MQPDIVVLEDPADADREVIFRQLKAYNEASVGTYPTRIVAILLKDAAGEVIGGLWGKISFEWLFVDLLSVAEAWRGRDFGTRLMRAAEQQASDQGCHGLWLNTFAFQARGFYEKLGFSVFGVLEDNPVGSRRFFLAKVIRSTC